MTNLLRSQLCLSERTMFVSYLISSFRMVESQKIFYKYLNSMTWAMVDSSQQFDEEVVEFFNSIKYLGGERTANFVRGPMWHGYEKGGTPNPAQAKPNLIGGTSKTTRSKHSSGYTTASGIVKPSLYSSRSS